MGRLLALSRQRFSESMPPPVVICFVKCEPGQQPEKDGPDYYWIDRELVPISDEQG